MRAAKHNREERGSRSAVGNVLKRKASAPCSAIQMQLGTAVINLAKDNILASGLWLTLCSDNFAHFYSNQGPIPCRCEFQITGDKGPGTDRCKH